MFYVKTRLNEATTIAVDIKPDNVFARCTQCGKELQFDLEDIVFHHDHLALDMKVFCSKDCCCAYHRENDMEILCDEEDDFDPFSVDDDD